MDEGEIVAVDSSKIYVDGRTYEGAEEVYDYLKEVRGYKLFVIYDIAYRIPIYFEVRGINDAGGPSLREMVEKAMEIAGKRIKRVYIDRGFYDVANFRWLAEEGMEYITRGNKGTELYERAAEPGADEFREVMPKTKEYEPKTARGKVAKHKRSSCARSPMALTFVWSWRRKERGYRVTTIILLEKLSGSYTAQERDLYKKEYGVEFSNSKNSAATITKALKRIPAIEVIGKGRGRRYRIRLQMGGIGGGREGRRNAYLVDERLRCSARAGH